MFQNQIIDAYNVLLFSTFIFLNQDNVSVLKLKLKLSSFVLILECLHERLKTFIDTFLNIE